MSGRGWMVDHEKKNKDYLLKQLEELHKESKSQRDLNNLQRIMRALKIQQLKMDIQNLEMHEVRQQLDTYAKKYTGLYDTSVTAYLTFDNQYHIRELNLAAADLLGEDREAILNKPFISWLTEEERLRFIQHIYQVSQSSKKNISELKIKRRDGELIDVCLESVAVRNAHGIAVECQTAMFDISELKSSMSISALRDYPQVVAETGRKSSQIQAQQKPFITEDAQTRDNNKCKQAAIVFDSTNEGIVFMDESFRLVNVNQAFCTMTGYASKEVIGEHALKLLVHRDDDVLYQELISGVENNGHWKGEIWCHRKNGERFPVWQNINVVKDDTGKIINYAAIISDISIFKEAQNKLEHLAHHDPLTGLPNRLHFSANLEQALKRATRNKRRLAVLLVDLDRFKTINDNLGHASGDVVLKIVAERLQDCVRYDDTAARLGGDEFIVLLEEITRHEDAAQVAKKIIDAVYEPITIHDKEITISASIGISVYPDDSEHADELVKLADTAMYHAKKNGRNMYQFYTSEVSSRLVKSQEMEKGLRQALRKGGFEIYYQPQIALSDDKVVGLEALLRWHHPEKGILLPNDFLPAAEDVGLTHEIDEWVVQAVCKQINVWQLSGLAPIRISINLTGRTLMFDHRLVSKIRKALVESQIDPSYLELEIPEHILQSNDSNIKKLHALKALGVRITIDDYGTGNSSINTLKLLPIDSLKIDRSLINEIPESGNDASIASAIIAMGHNMKIKVSAKGVGTNGQRSYLKGQGCDEMQGFMFGEPMPQNMVREFIRSKSLH
ncbi:MAG TPA: EAL domain-containing protein [Gammaproteobacteria bacterium]